MPYANTSPLTDQHLTLINQGLRNIADARKVISKAENAGMDMSAHTQVADQMEAVLTGFKKEFFGKPHTKGE